MSDARDDREGLDDSKAPLLDHLIELRKRLLISVVGVVVLFFIAFYFSQQIYDFLAAPLRRTLGPDAKLISTEVTGQLWVRVEVALYSALMVGFPFLANQLWAFVAPGLYRHEKRALLPFLMMTPVLFSIGVTLAYLAMPIALKALLIGPFSLVGGVDRLDLAITPDVQKYLSFVRQLLFAFGFAFLLPVAIMLLNRAGILPLETLRKGRRYAILIAFVIAAVITPPDITSQFLLAIPLILLYELSLLAIMMTNRKAAAKPAPASTDVTASGETDSKPASDPSA